MKIRKGFVSNSSSSSFICEICAHTETGYDQSPTELGFVQCVNEHIFCEEHLLQDAATEDLIDTDDNGEVYPERCCPICQFKEYSQGELSIYLREVYGIDRDVVFAEIKKLNKRRKKLYDYEYIEYVFKQFNLTDDMILAELKNKYITYQNFMERKIV
jgi:hypothetical protein